MVVWVWGGGGGGGGGGNNSIAKMVDSYTSQYEARRDLSSIKVVVDMDMFFAAVAIRDRPHLKDKPVAIGGMWIAACMIAVHVVWSNHVF